ncbi:MAG: rod shape-determining protein MreD [Clostridiales bacterium]|nr:rod shape-determining protein MreD [Clostridiales bacterium]MCD7827116.1 rod shape-determining protein MreD [Clostridiales bacterium]
MFKREGFYIFAKRILLLALCILTAMFQNTEGLLPEIFGSRFMPLIPLAVCIGIFRGEMSGLIYGAIAGCFWDVCSSGADGIHAFYLAFIGCAAGVLTHYLMRRNIVTQYCLTTVSCVIFVLIYWFITVYIPVGDAEYKALLTFYLPSAVITIALSFVSYFTVKLITGEKRND